MTPRPSPSRIQIQCNWRDALQGLRIVQAQDHAGVDEDVAHSSQYTCDLQNFNRKCIHLIAAQRKRQNYLPFSHLYSSWFKRVFLNFVNSWCILTLRCEISRLKFSKYSQNIILVFLHFGVTHTFFQIKGWLELQSQNKSLKILPNSCS